MATIDATVAGASSNSYMTEAEANAYFDERLPLTTPWVVSGANNARALIMATRVLDAMAQPHVRFVRDSQNPYYYTSPYWTGAVATATQRLAWPRTGMFDRLGRAIAEDAIPYELKEAQAELAGQLLISDTTLDNAAAAQGISSVRAGSVSVTFRDMIEQHVLPDAVLALLPASWLTDPGIDYAVTSSFDFEVL